ncbi:MAG: hypothetical protein IIA87_01445 [Nanoarchaeota archaeon]|nr:hypothetical protein [Nanoarchaeota archaeon]
MARRDSLKGDLAKLAKDAASPPVEAVRDKVRPPARAVENYVGGLIGGAVDFVGGAIDFVGGACCEGAYNLFFGYDD